MKPPEPPAQVVAPPRQVGKWPAPDAVTAATIPADAAKPAKTRAEAEAWLLEGEPVAGVLAWDLPLTTPADGGTPQASPKGVWMDASDAGEMAVIGAKIVEVGAKLNAARTELMAAQVKVTELEAQLSPLIAQHAAIIQKVVGGIVQVPALSILTPPQVSGSIPSNPTPGGKPMLSLAQEGSPQALPEAKQLKARVKDYLSKKNPEGISASEVAEVLHIDPLVVREAMLEMKWA